MLLLLLFCAAHTSNETKFLVLHTHLRVTVIQLWCFSCKNKTELLRVFSYKRRHWKNCSYFGYGYQNVFLKQICQSFFRIEHLPIKTLCLVRQRELVSISSTFFVQKHNFGAKILYESCILGLKFLAPNFVRKSFADNVDEIDN